MTPVRRPLPPVGLLDVVRYSGASGDTNPIHYDPAFAAAAGYDGVFSMGMLHGGWLISELLDDLRWYDRPVPIATRLRYEGVLSLDEPIAATVTVEEGVRSGVLVSGDRQIVTASVEMAATAEAINPDSDVQEDEFRVELGNAVAFAKAVRWHHPVADGTPVPPTYTTALTFWHTNPDPIVRVGFDRARTLLGSTAVDLSAGPLRVGERFRVKEFVANRRYKKGRKGTLQFADAVSELYDDDTGLRASYRNTFVLLPAADDAAPRTVEPLKGSRDPATGQVFWPPRTWSVDGQMRDLEEAELSTSGVLYSWTTFEGQAFGQVDLPEGVRVQTALSGNDHAIGATYRLAAADATAARGEGWCFTRA